MGASVVSGAVNLAWHLINQSILWAAVGKTSIWGNPDTPSTTLTTTTDINEIVAFKKIGKIGALGTDSLIKLCYEDVNGTIIFNGYNYTSVADNLNTAITNSARWIYARTLLYYSNFPLTTFRQIGWYLDCVPATGYENADMILAANMSNNGKLLQYENIGPITRDANSKNIIELIYEVRCNVI